MVIFLTVLGIILIGLGLFLFFGGFLQTEAGPDILKIILFLILIGVLFLAGAAGLASYWG